MTSIKEITFSMFLWGVVILFGSAAARANDITGYDALCDEVAHEVQISWQEGRLSREEATAIIDSCYAWSDRNK